MHALYGKSIFRGVDCYTCIVLGWLLPKLAGDKDWSASSYLASWSPAGEWGSKVKKEWQPVWGVLTSRSHLEPLRFLSAGALSFGNYEEHASEKSTGGMRSWAIY